MLVEYFFENLRALKELNGIKTNVMLANVTGIPRGRINNWFSRNAIANPEDIEELAKFFKVQPYYFFMEPGTQGEVKPTERHDEFKTFLDKLASEHLSKEDLDAYHSAGGANQFVRQMRDNLETSFLGFQDWYQILAKEVARYAGLDLVEKVRRDMSKSKVPTTKKSESA